MITDTACVLMESLKPHTFAGTARPVGTVYEVEGDGTQTAAQYADTLIALQFARRVTGGVRHGAAVPLAPSTEVAPMGTTDGGAALAAPRTLHAKPATTTRK